jgi:hypothetical protein
LQKQETEEVTTMVNKKYPLTDAIQSAVASVPDGKKEQANEEMARALELLGIGFELGKASASTAVPT